MGWISSGPLLPHDKLVEIIVSCCSLNVGLATLGWLYETRVRDLVHHLEDERRMFRERSVRDSLTGLANRSLVMECLLRSRERCRRLGLRGALFFIDLDGFKSVNDNHGHAAGDQVLRAVAGRLSSVLRRSDLAGRLGGDEFALIVEGLEGSVDASAVAQTLHAALEMPFEVDDAQVRVGASIGIAFYPDEDESPPEIQHPREQSQENLWHEHRPTSPSNSSDSVEEILKRADAAMYDAKRRRSGTSIDGQENRVSPS
jgi:diguanylate cyclase (GGDEF)-like protein